MDIFLDQPASSHPIDPKEENRGYKLSFLEIVVCLITLTGVVYAERHFDRANSLGENFLGLVECCPVLGLAVAAVERVAAAVFKWSNSSQIKTPVSQTDSKKLNEIDTNSIIEDLLKPYLEKKTTSEKEPIYKLLPTDGNLLEILKSQLESTEELKEYAIDIFMDKAISHYKRTPAENETDWLYISELPNFQNALKSSLKRVFQIEWNDNTFLRRYKMIENKILFKS